MKPAPPVTKMRLLVRAMKLDASRMLAVDGA